MNTEQLRLMAWNCAGTLRRTASHITSAAPDIAILSEAPEDSASLISDDASGAWLGAGKKRGLAVVGLNGWRIERVPISLNERLFLPVKAVRGGTELHVVGVCAKKDGDYVAPTLRALSTLSDFIVSRGAILAGDFNQSARFDAKRKPDRRFARVVELTSRLGLASAWHTFHGEGHGRESSWTYFHLWNKQQPFHIDYVFVPKSIAIRGVDLGGFQQVVAAGLSDHVPLTVDIQVPAQSLP